MNKVLYKELEMEVIKFDAEDVITTSTIYPSYSPITNGSISAHANNNEDDI